MGTAFSQTFYPCGYREWLEQANVTGEDGINVEYVKEFKQRVIHSCKHCKDDVAAIEKDKEAWLLTIGKGTKPIDTIRPLYDALVSNVLADFWILLNEQDPKDMKEYFQKNRPKDFEKIFYDMQIKYKLDDPSTLIHYYKNDCK